MYAHKYIFTCLNFSKLKCTTQIVYEKIVLLIYIYIPTVHMYFPKSFYVDFM